jgi:hypothetical protein
MSAGRITKVAVVRDQSVPAGQPGPLTLNCPCGASPATTWLGYISGPDVTCTCGVTYTANGWVVIDEESRWESEGGA